MENACRPAVLAANPGVFGDRSRRTERGILRWARAYFRSRWFGLAGHVSTGRGQTSGVLLCLVGRCVGYGSGARSFVSPLPASIGLYCAG